LQHPALSILRAGSFPKDGSEPLEKKDQIFQGLTARLAGSVLYQSSLTLGGQHR